MARREDAMDQYHNQIFITLDIAVQAPGVAHVSLLLNGIIYVSLGMHKPLFFCHSNYLTSLKANINGRRIRPEISAQKWSLPRTFTAGSAGALSRLSRTSCVGQARGML